MPAEGVVKTSGIALVIIGYVLMVLNAIEYVRGFFGLSLEIGASMIIGVVQVVVGMPLANKKKN